MSDQTKRRSVDEIRNEYSQLCSKLGHVEYQIYVLEKDVEMMLKTLGDLNFEAAASARADEEAKKASEAKAE